MLLVMDQMGGPAMQLQSVETYAAGDLVYAFIADGLAAVQYGGYACLLYAARSDNRLAAIDLGPAPTAPVAGNPVIGPNPGADIVVQDNPGSDRAFVFSSYDGLLRHAALGSTGLPGLTKGTMTSQGYLYGVTSMEIVERGATDLAIIAQRDVPGLHSYTIADTGAISLVASLADSPKSYLADVADSATVKVAGRDFLLTASALENGLSLFEIDAAGEVSFVDALGSEDGLPIAGPAALLGIAHEGRQFVVVASTISASISVVRINEMGVLFVADHRIDDRNTRFDNVVALDGFAYAGRAFVVTGGSDAGVTVLELLPDGRLSPVLSQALETGAGIGPVTGVEAVVLNGKVAIFLTDAGGDRIHHFEIDLAAIGDLYQTQGGTLSGSALDDRMIGSELAESLQGGGGDDFLHDGGGDDLLLGGAGADVFVFDRDGSADRIGDFQDGIDRLDVSDWGRIYTASALNIMITASGAVVSYGAESLTITTSGTAALQLTDADFLF